jgi:Cu2+-exporting ATPase
LGFSQKGEVACPHCGTKTPALAPSAPFCCRGCRGAQALLRSAGLERFYDLRNGRGLPVGEISLPSGGRPWLLPLLEKAEKTAAQGRSGRAVTIEVDVQGLHCAACVWLLQRIFAKNPGQLRLDINPGLGRMALTAIPGVFDFDGYFDAIASFGYRTGPARKSAENPADNLLLRFGISAALAMNTMLLSLAIYFGLSPENEPGLYQTFVWGGALLATAAVWVGGGVFFRGALLALRQGILHLDLPIALGIALAWAGSVASAIFSQGRAAYFDTLTVFIALVLLGRFVQTRVVEKNKRLLLDETGTDDLYVRAVVKEGDGDKTERIVIKSAHEVVAGDRILLPRGALNLTRSRLAEGAESSADFSLAWITGEGDPITFETDQEIPAGAEHQSGGPRVVEALENFDRSQLHRILSPAQVGSEALSQKLWSRFAQVYVAGVLSLAGLGAFWWWDAGLVRMLDVVVAVLVVTCPCAIGLATPLAVELAQSRLRRMGLFVRRGSFFDRAAQINRVVFDKTGTLTLGQPRLLNDAELATLAPSFRNALYTLVSGSTHPKSRALLRALTRPGLPHPFRTHGTVVETPGLGLSLTDHGNTRWSLEKSDDDLLFSQNGHGVMAFHFEEALHHDTHQEIVALRDQGISVHLCSGDAPERVDLLAQRLGIAPHRARGGLSPDDKVAMIRDLDRGDTLMVGDGLNDALALDAATCSATPAGAAAQLGGRVDLFFLGEGVGRIHQALALARHLRRVALGNLGLAAAYNVGAVALALSGVMTPLICAVAMPLSSLVVVGTTVWRLGRDAESPAPGEGAFGLVEVQP